MRGHALRAIIALVVIPSIYPFYHSYYYNNVHERPTIYQLVHSLWLVQRLPCGILPHWEFPQVSRLS